MSQTVPSLDNADPPPQFRLPGWLLGPMLLWMGIFFILPLLVMLAVSFAGRGTYGGVEWTFSLTNYAQLSDSLYLRVYCRSLALAMATTTLCLLLGYPLAYSIARASVRWQGVWLLLVMIPFWTNFLVRTYAWMFILRTEGLMNQLLINLGVMTQPIELLYSDWAILIGLVYGYVPFMVLPLYVAMERLDSSVVEAAWDLYATGWSVFWRVVLPLTKPGVVAGCILVFIPSLGAFITPDLLGGAKTMMVGNLIQHEYLVARDWPLGSAISFSLMALVLLGVLVYFKTDGRLDRFEGGG